MRTIRAASKAYDNLVDIFQQGDRSRFEAEMDVGMQEWVQVSVSTQFNFYSFECLPNIGWKLWLSPSAQEARALVPLAGHAENLFRASDIHRCKLAAQHRG